MAIVLDMCSGQWERDEMDGTLDLESIEEGLSMELPHFDLELGFTPLQHTTGQCDPKMPVDILSLDVDRFLGRMRRQ